MVNQYKKSKKTFGDPGKLQFPRHLSEFVFFFLPGYYPMFRRSIRETTSRTGTDFLIEIREFCPYLSVTQAKSLKNRGGQWLKSQVVRGGSNTQEPAFRQGGLCGG
jgi:hypothetical protein